MSMVQEVVEEYATLNQYAQRNKVVIMGSTTASHLAIGELLQDYEISTKVYNRSMEGLHIQDAVQFMHGCVSELKPSRLLLHLGETELQEAKESLQEIVDQYRWLLYEIHMELPKTELYLVPVMLDHPLQDALNQALYKLSREYGCEFLECPMATKKSGVSLPFFRSMKTCLMEKDCSFFDAMHVASI